MISSGKAAGGHARAAALTAERRTEIAKTAAASRWKGHAPIKDAAKVALPDDITAGAAWLRNSLGHQAKETRILAASARRSAVRSPQLRAAAEHLARTFEAAAAVYEAALNGVIG